METAKCGERSREGHTEHVLLEAHRDDVVVTNDVLLEAPRMSRKQMPNCNPQSVQSHCCHRRGLLEELRKGVAIANDGNIVMLQYSKAA